MPAARWLASKRPQDVLILSAHVFQGIEIYRGKPIFYDTGDLLDDYLVDPSLRNDRQLLFVVTAAPGKIRRIELLPIRIQHMQVNLARNGEFAAIADRARRLSNAFGTRIERVGDKLVVETADPEGR